MSEVQPIILNSPMRVGSTYLARLLVDYYGFVDSKYLDETDWDIAQNLVDDGYLIKCHCYDREAVEVLAHSLDARVISITRNPLFATISRIRHLVNWYHTHRPNLDESEIKFLGLSKPFWSKTGTMTLEEIIEATKRYPEVPQWYFRDVVRFGKDTDLTFNRLMDLPRMALASILPIQEPIDSAKIGIVVDRHTRGRDPDPEILEDPQLTELLTLLI